MSPATSIRICVLQLPALLRREAGLPPATLSALSPSSLSPSSLSSGDSRAVLERKQQQMQRIKEALAAAVAAMKRGATSSTFPFTAAFDHNIFSSAPVQTSYRGIVDALATALGELGGERSQEKQGHEEAHGNSRPFDVLVLPEMWNTPYHNSCFAAYGEPLPDLGDADEEANEEEMRARVSPSFAFMKEMAKRLRVCVVGGSIVERREVPDESAGKDTDRKKVELYNTCCVFDREGAFIAKHRKMHLFDISILKSDDPNGKGMIFRESATLSAGNSLSSFSLAPFGSVGLGICYDLRFAEMALALTQQRNCKLLCYPGAFNQTTGPPHWSLLLRGRALDNQVYVVGCSPAAPSPSVSGEGEYPVYGHSTVIGPYGDVIAELGGGPGAIFASLDRTKVDLFRKQVPTSLQKRFGEVYTQVQEVTASDGAHRRGTGQQS
ncbi:genome sequencing data, contig C317, related [Neospora caninum Liverpool]|uniref:Genome sequencing data, contig C317, related n=1 Tax=Neospora caninum (strain Liverpool) TaxID=572307 RepID=F0VBA6_NEOCL|nr:genome sequencing data, contig C317, related [Neospora caninum Liverpool]CBZ50890.1 genome sequencing data, contig C317, related [Neospora caninum Liverpool]CEL68192.1 TPA: Genome sequencing data, contig C317, related [Neospora caninum Liverpool]|eukprot:XP_003880923.1 genome sequencing data, contig C317, related [Neospora caninum Liverpool]